MKRAVFFGNCQIHTLCIVYNSFVAPFENGVGYFISSSEDMTDAHRKLIADADLFVGQVVHSTSPGIPEELPAKARSHFVPYLNADFLWPFGRHGHPRGAPYVGELCDRFLNSMIRQGVDPSEAVQRYLSLDVNATTNLDRLLELTIEHQRLRDTATGYAFADTILANFRDKYLFQSPSHMTNPFTRSFCIDVFRRLGVVPEAVDEIRRNLQWSPFLETALPIHPAVIRHFGLTFLPEVPRYNFFGEGEFTFDEFCLRYMRFEWDRNLDEALKLAHTGDLEVATTRLAAALTHSPKSAQGWMELGRLLSAQGKRNEALEALRRAVGLEPGNAHAHSLLSQTLARTKQWKEAEAEGRIAVGLARQWAWSHLELSSVFAQQGCLEDATEEAMTAIIVEPDSALAHSQLGRLLVQVGRLQEAEAAFLRSITLAPEVAGNHFSLSQVLVRLNRLDAAIGVARRAAELAPADPHSHHHLSNLLERTGDLDATIDAARRSAELQPTNAHAYRYLGQLLLRAERLDEAATFLRRAIELAPEAAESHIILSRVLARSNDLDGAEQAGLKAIELNPDLADFHGHVGDILARQGKLEAAIEAVRRCAELEPSNPHVHNHLSHLLARCERFDEAETAILQAINLAPETPGFHTHLSHLLARQNTSEARVRSRQAAALAESVGIEAVEAFWSQHGSEQAWNFLMLNIKYGEVYMVASLMKAFRKLRARGHMVRVFAVGRPQFEIVSLFADDIDEIVTIPPQKFTTKDVVNWRIATQRIEFRPGMLMTMQPFDYFKWPLHQSAFWFFFSDRGIVLVHLYKFLMELPLQIGPSVPVVKDESRRAARALFLGLGLSEGKSLILFPYAYSVAQSESHVMKHFTALAQHAESRGFEVYTSVGPSEAPVEGTRGIFIPFSLLVPFCDLAGYVVATRSGAGDVLSATTCRKIHIAADKKHVDRYSPLAFGLGGMETNLVFNFLVDENPSHFAETVVSSLISHDPGAFVPGYIKDLLMVPPKGANRSGRFNTAELILSHNNQVIFSDGVLAEGWTGVEDWGTWTLGYRSILYLKPAMPHWFEPSDIVDGDVVLELEFILAIAPETQPDLQYNIEVNGIRSDRAGHWPNRGVVLQFVLEPRVLTEPVRVTFDVVNPESTRALSGGKNNDDRVIGIGLVRASYILERPGKLPMNVATAEVGRPSET